MNTVHISTVSDMYLYLLIAISNWHSARMWLLNMDLLSDQTFYFYGLRNALLSVTFYIKHTGIQQ
jgi:hypothetical protein